MKFWLKIGASFKNKHGFYLREIWAEWLQIENNIGTLDDILKVEEKRISDNASKNNSE